MLERNRIDVNPDVLPKGIDQGAGGLKRLQITLKRNKGSGYTEKMEQIRDEFEYEPNKDAYWIPERYSCFYGSPIWDQASESQRKALNHLAYCVFYNQIIAAEDTTIVFNQVAAGAFYYMNGYEVVCKELDVESQQERVHIDCFTQITEKTDEALFGEYIIARRRPHWLRAAMTHPVGEGRRTGLLETIQYHLATVNMSGSPFLASQFFTVRGLRNIAGKIRENQFQEIAVNANKEGTWAPAPCHLSDYHARDESFHTATSQILSHDLRLDFRMTRNDKLWSNVMLFGAQKVDAYLSAAMPIVFRADAPFMPIMYRVLRSRLFNCDHEQALSLLERSFCQETGGMSATRDTHIRLREDSLKYIADLGHLWPINRELRRMPTPEIGTAVRANIKAFKAFKANAHLLKQDSLLLSGSRPRELPAAQA